MTDPLPARLRELADDVLSDASLFGVQGGAIIETAAALRAAAEEIETQRKGQIAEAMRWAEDRHDLRRTRAARGALLRRTMHEINETNDRLAENGMSAYANYALAAEIAAALGGKTDE